MWVLVGRVLAFNVNTYQKLSCEINGFVKVKQLSFIKQ